MKTAKLCKLSLEPAFGKIKPIALALSFLSLQQLCNYGLGQRLGLRLLFVN
jgi:hypothetical protein